MKKLFLLAAAFVASFAFAGTAQAATPTLTVQGSDDAPTKGFDVVASDGWKIDDCSPWMSGYKDGSSDGYGWAGNVAAGPVTGKGTSRLHMGELYYPGSTHMLPSSYHATKIEVTCNVHKTTTTYTHEWRSFTKARSGTDTSSRSKSGNCFFTGLFGALSVDCWGGNYAKATYGFNLPSDARHVTRTIRGSVGCCNRGSISRSWSGNKASVTVTGWREFTVKRVAIHYDHRVRVAHRSTERVNGVDGTWTA